EAGNPRRTAVQWIELDRNGAFVQGGRIADRSATGSNGGRWYAYPSISVNAVDDVLVGFSAFRSSGFPSAAYAFRYGTDPPHAFAPPCRVPRVVGLGLAKARTRIRTRHCRLGKIAYRHSARKQRGHVVRQRPGPGRRLGSGAKVTIWIGR